MRIIQLVHNLTSTGGVERFIYNLSRKIIELGHETIVVTVEPVENLRHWGKDTFSHTSLEADSSTWLKTISALHPDLVMWHGASEMAELVKKVAAIYPVVATVHGAVCPSGSRLFTDNDEICFQKGGYSCLLNWYGHHHCGFGRSPIGAIQAIRKHQAMITALSQCKRIYPVSESVMRFLEIEGIPKRNMRIFDNTLGIVHRMRFCSIHPICDERPLRILYVGRLVYNKGVQYLIQAVKHLVIQGEDVECDIVGEGWHQGTLEAMVDNLGLGGVITFHGKVPGTEIKGMYAECDIVVVPSIWPEPAGLVVPEAREQGKPVVVFDAGGLPEWMWFMDGVHVATRADAMSLVDEILKVKSTYANPVYLSDHTTPFEKTRVDILEDCESFVGMI